MKTQWNTMNKAAMDSLVSYAKGYASFAKARTAYAKNVKTLEESRKNDELCIRVLNKLETAETQPIHDLKWYVEDIKRVTTDIAVYAKKRDDAKEEADKLKASAYACIPTSIHTAYTKRDDDMNAYKTTIKEWGKSIGVDITDSTMDILVSTIGDKATDSEKYLNKNGLVCFREDAFKKIFINKVCRLANIKFD